MRLAAIERWVYTRPCKAKNKDVLLRVPRFHYFSIRYREISMTMAHLPEIKKQKTLIFQGKRLDYMRRDSRKNEKHYSNPTRSESVS